MKTNEDYGAKAVIAELNANREKLLASHTSSKYKDGARKKAAHTVAEKNFRTQAARYRALRKKQK